jgi:hypothetical protein
MNVGDRATVTLAVRQSRRNGPGIAAGSQVEILRTMPSKYGNGLAYLVRDLVTSVERWTDETHIGPLGATPGTGATVTCSTCGAAGHNSRTCPGVTAAAVVAAGIPAADPPAPADPVAAPAPALTFPNDWAKIEAVAKVCTRVLLYGPPGTGKTTAGHADPPAAGVVNLTLTEETPAAELRGHFVPKGGDFVWMDGPVTTAARTGARLILDEIDHASTDALTFLLAVLNDHGMNSFTLPTGERVEPVESFSAFATMNGVPEDLPDALRSRFGAKIEVTEPHPAAVSSLPPRLRDAALRSIKSDPDRAVTFREWKNFAGLTESLDEATAAWAVFGARADDILNTIAIGGN